MSIRKYGTSNDEKILQESKESKDIVKAILDHGVSQKQILYIINDLALNLENMDHTKKIINTLEELVENDVESIILK